MDPPWSPSSAKRSFKRKAHSPPLEEPSHPPEQASSSQMSPTALPPIREIQASLPSPGPPSQVPEDVYHQHPQTTGFPSFSGSNPLHMSQAIPSTPAAADNSGTMDSEPEADAEPSGRPKQKRRRQALSCTECKRRKVKCDRAHPCGPCARRGDQNKCQWRVTEPVDKYVSHAEFDEVKLRLNKLEAIAFSIPSGLLPPSSSIELSSRSATTGAGLSPASSASHRYAEPHHQTAFPTGPSRREDYHSKHTSSKHSNPAWAHVTAPSQTAHPALSQPHFQTFLGQSSSPLSPAFRSYETTRSPPHNVRRTGGGEDTGPGAVSIAGPSSAVKPSPFSLSAITAPYNTPIAPPLPRPYPKNSYAQTFTPLGERLRIRVVQGPAASTCLYLSHTVDSHNRSLILTRILTLLPRSRNRRPRRCRPRHAHRQRHMIMICDLIV